MNVNPREAPAETEYEGRTYYFCSEECKDQFEMAPQQYLSRKTG